MHQLRISERTVVQDVEMNKVSHHDAPCTGKDTQNTTLIRRSLAKDCIVCEPSIGEELGRFLGTQERRGRREEGGC